MLLRYEAKTGETLNFSPKRFKPLSFEDLESSNDRGEQNYYLEIEVSSIEGLPDQNQPSGPGTIRMPISFRQPVSVFGLVEGGWLPPPFRTTSEISC